MIKKLNAKIIRTGIIFIILLFFAACNNGQGNVPQDSTVTPMILPPTETITIPPTETPMPGRVVLVAPTDLPGAYVNSAQVRLANLVDAVGMTFEVRETINESDIGSDWKIIVFLKMPDNLTNIRNSASSLQYVIFSDDPELRGEGNLSVVYTSQLEQAFMAGYVTMINSPDFRAGGLLVWDDPVSGALQQEAFENGAAYFCGRCASVYMPVSLFPVTASLPSSSSPSAWQDAFSALNNEFLVYTTYVNLQAESSELLRALTELNVVLVGAETPSDMTGLRWSATVRNDSFTALETIWSDLIAGNGGQTIQTDVEIIDVNEEYLSSGRMRLVEETLGLLMDGAILPISPDYP